MGISQSLKEIDVINSVASPGTDDNLELMQNKYRQSLKNIQNLYGISAFNYENNQFENGEKTAKFINNYAKFSDFILRQNQKTKNNIKQIQKIKIKNQKKIFHTNSFPLHYFDDNNYNNIPNSEPLLFASNKNSSGKKKIINAFENISIMNEQLKRKQILQIEESESDNFENIKKFTNTNKKDIKLINDCLTKHFFMHSLNELAREAIIEEMSLVEIKKDKYIFKQGNLGNFFYILKSGKAELYINKKFIKTLRIGESFGELALLHDSPRTGSIRTKEDCLLWVLERKNFRKIVDHINKLNYEENLKFIDSVNILNNIENYQKTILSTYILKEEFNKNQTIVNKGEESHCLYIIKEGRVKVVNNGKTIKILKNGDNFGERGILIDTNRTMDVITETKCICYSISKSSLKHLLSDKYRNFLYFNFLKAALKKSKYLNKINEYYLTKIFPLFQAVNLGEDHVAYPKGHNKSSQLIVIIDGNLINSKTKQIIASRGEILFEEEIINLKNEKTDFALFPEPDVLLLEADIKKILNCLGVKSLTNFLNKCEIFVHLCKIPLFKNLSKNKINDLSSLIQRENYIDNQVIIKENEKGEKFYIVKSGQVNFYKNNNYLRTINAKEYFGERSLLKNELRSATAISKGKTELFTLSKKEFLNNIEQNMKMFLIDRLFLRDNTIELEDLYFIKELGEGNFGNVSLVYSKKNNYLYAIKARKQNPYFTEKILKNIDIEKEILLKVDSPFIVKLVKSLEYKNNYYLLMEYLEGKDLFEVIRDIGLLNKKQTIFFSAIIFLAIKYLHKRKFIYRDIKPENIIVIKNGYLKLIDFGTVKEITDRTCTIIGTPHYMAPEVILGEGYSFQIDYWSIAICMYEFICGGVPFGEVLDDPIKIYSSVIKDKLEFPKFCKDKEFKQLMSNMLEKNPMKRLTKFDEIKKHIWFKEFNWEELITLNMKAPYVPKIKKDKFMVNNFDLINYKENDNKDKKVEQFINKCTTKKYINYEEHKKKK